MCGVAGFVELGSVPTERLLGVGRAMAAAIAHRGPDDEGVWFHEALGVLLAHRRLSIVDLSPEGRQPMQSASGRYVAAFNGEIYNFNELRAEVERSGAAPRWRGHSDTEVMLAVCDMWGIDKALRLANGMFAIAIVDLAARQLVLARDRLGEKPLYYGWQGNSFVFGSELKALARHPSFQPRVDSDAVTQYVRFGYVPAPRSIYVDIRKLPPGCSLSLSLGAGRVSPHVQAYWTAPIPQAVEVGDEEEATDRLDALLRRAVALRMHADVPLGAFLSGGIDSSTIVALAQAQSNRPVRTFSMGFRERALDESKHASAIAGAVGTQHTNLLVTAADALAVIDRLPQIYDEPFADSSQIPTFLLAKLTRASVTVALSGDGGDELFGGYNRHFQAQRLASFGALMPGALRAWGARALATIPGRRWDRMLSFAPQSTAVLLGGDRLTKLASVLAGGGALQIYKQLVSQWKNPLQLRPGRVEHPTLLDDAALADRILSPVSWMMYMDQLTYLPDDILVKVDRASMAVALETRVPFLDPDVVAFAASLPLHLKIRGGVGKWLLRRVLYRYLDPGLFRRPKQGFAIPLADWLRGALRDWAEDLLSAEALAETGLAQPAEVQDAWRRHLSGRENLQSGLWVLLMYQQWHRHARPLAA
jgi:asparagine synthase (glutamine-hydrolysing)